jgi:hypothetical protein
MIALARFQVSGYIRSYRMLPQVIVVALLMLILFQQWPQDDPRFYPGLIAGAYADAAAFLVPIGAWATRTLLDTEPDVQRDLSLLAAGDRTRTALAGLLGAFTVNAGLAVPLAVFPIAQTISFSLGPGVIANGLALLLVSAAAATAFGAWTSRVIMPSTVAALLTLIGGSVLLVVLSMGALRVISIPLVEWVRAGHRGPSALASALPGLAGRTALWTAVVACGYVAVRRTRP